MAKVRYTIDMINVTEQYAAVWSSDCRWISSKLSEAYMQSLLQHRNDKVDTSEITYTASSIN
jgi:hypothetical protein